MIIKLNLGRTSEFHTHKNAYVNSVVVGEGGGPINIKRGYNYCLMIRYVKLTRCMLWNLLHLDLFLFFYIRSI